MSGDSTSGDAGIVWTIVVAAGSGSRFGAPKQFLDLGGVSVLDRSIATAARHSAGVVVVMPADPVAGVVSPTTSVALVVVAGGATRTESVRNGLAAVPSDAAIVLVHDAARPLASDRIYESVIAAVSDGADAATPAVPVADTLRRRGGGVVDRDGVVAVQTPQGFAAPALRAAHASGKEATDDVTVVEADGGTVVLVDGDRRNLKLTTPLDLVIAAALIVALDKDSL
ncbi:MAG: 2-C-methyl-D-erythritol 4-phosphate cytidylyltransferase [Candidatus Aldehydirespiratoraceae bacterium]|jgi:2-C-methyl-D-erythritol 4-phosphate cytidylyltransferase